MSRGSIQLVCFDLGGVLIRVCHTWREGCQAAGFDLRGQWRNGDPDFEGRCQISGLFSTGQIDGPTWAQRLSGAWNGLYSPQEISTIHRAWLLGEYEGTAAVIDRIHDRGLQTASLSNTDADHWARMPEFPAVMKLQHRWASHLLGHQKPDPAIYREFERRVRRAGAEILFFDDLFENVEAARSVGWNAVRIDPSSRTDVQIEAALRERGVLSGKR